MRLHHLSERLQPCLERRIACVQVAGEKVQMKLCPAVKHGRDHRNSHTAADVARQIHQS